MTKPSEISEILIGWYETNRRELPWRETTDAYLIWISEVILQQTRVAQGLEYYLRFTGRFPDVGLLASAHEDEVLKLWQGLGYYSRARNLHAAAREVVERFGGVFPATYEEVRSLRGIGDYTAAAVCSFAYGLPCATVDGNVYRVLSRLLGIDTPIDTSQGRKEFQQAAASLLDPRRAGLHNQAMMEFGALQCTPRNPDCMACPLVQRCAAFGQGAVDRLPVKSVRGGVQPRYFNYLHLRCEGRTLLVQRTAKDIWRNLYEFPLIETGAPADFESLRGDARFEQLFRGTDYAVLHSVAMPKHQLSHRTIHARFYEIRVDRLSGVAGQLPQARIVRDGEISDYAIARLTERYLERREVK